jgi:hypothetical protein
MEIIIKFQKNNLQKGNLPGKISKPNSKITREYLKKCYPEIIQSINHLILIQNFLKYR